MATLIKTNLLSRINVGCVSVGHFANGLYFDVIGMFTRNGTTIYTGDVYDHASRFMFKAEVNDDTGLMTSVHRIDASHVAKACWSGAMVIRRKKPDGSSYPKISAYSR